MPQPLTAENITFFSFRHSQGDNQLQYGIFNYMQVNFEVVPCHNPDTTELARYQRFITGAHSTHVPHDDVELTSRRFSDFLFNPGDPDAEAVFKRYDPSSQHLIAQLALGVIQREEDILNLGYPWGSNFRSKEILQERRERLSHRIRQGQSSFLYLYGRDEKPTEMLEFDAMYRDMWAAIVRNQARKYRATPLQKNIDRHFRAHKAMVKHAELHYAGELILGSER